jgi:hypothetical protein
VPWLGKITSPPPIARTGALAGSDPLEMLAELFGKGRCCRQRAVDTSATSTRACIRPLPLSPDPGRHGDGLALKMQKRSQVVACFFGTGNTQALSTKGEYGRYLGLPVIYAARITSTALLPYQQSPQVKSVAERAGGYGISQRWMATMCLRSMKRPARPPVPPGVDHLCWAAHVRRTPAIRATTPATTSQRSAVTGLGAVIGSLAKD